MGARSALQVGLNPKKPTWFYLMHKPGEQQLGIIKILEDRIQPHKSSKWMLLDESGVSIIHTQPPGGFSLSMTPDAVATSRRRYTTKAPQAGQEQVKTPTTALSSKAGRQQAKNPPSTKT